MSSVSWMTFDEWGIAGMLLLFAYGLYYTWKKAWVEGYMSACEDVAHKRIEVSLNEFDEE